MSTCVKTNFSDEDGIVSRAYRKPSPGTVFLIDFYGRVAVVGKAGQSDRLTARADRLVVEAEAFQVEAYTGG